jgi:hypothetical protein
MPIEQRRPFSTHLPPLHAKNRLLKQITAYSHSFIDVRILYNGLLFYIRVINQDQPKINAENLSYNQNISP